MSPRPHNGPVCIDERMIGVVGTGVSSYATVLQAMLPQLTGRPMLLGAGTPRPGRLRRLLAAARPGTRKAHDDGPAPGGERRIVARDIFREAQVHFDLYGQLLTVRAPFAGGIMHWTYPVPLRVAGWANIYTVHDAIPLVSPDLTPIDPRRHRRLLRRIAAVTDRIVAVSHAAAEEIVAALGCPASLVETVGQAVNPCRGADVALPEPLAPGGYLLVCGAIEPRKNIARILEGYRRSGVALPLVFVGPDGWRAAELAARIAATPGARRLPWQSREQVDALIGRARALVMPSLAEGFGLPVAEAMALGVAVIASHAGALAETAGGAALLVDPLDTADIARALRQVSGDDALCARLAAAGRVRAAAFAPDAIAARLVRLYADVVASSGASAYPRSPHPAGNAT